MTLKPLPINTLLESAKNAHNLAPPSAPSCDVARTDY